MSVVLCDSLEQFATLRRQFDELLAASDSRSVFLSWQWTYSWAERFVRGDRQLFLLLISEGSRLQGIAPLYVTGTRRGFQQREIRFLGLPESGSDYLGLIARRGKEQVVAGAVLDSLFGRFRGAWDVACLREMRGESTSAAALLVQLRRAGKHYTVQEGSYCPSAVLSEGFETYIASVSGHRRQQYKRELKMLFTGDEVVHRVVTNEDDLPESLRQFRRLYETRWGSDCSDLFGLLTAYIGQTSGAGLELSMLTAKDRLVAGLVHLKDGTALRMYLMAIDRTFNPAVSLGNIMCGLNIQHACEAGYRLYDFLKGDEPYKAGWMNTGQRALDVTIYNRTVPSLLGYIAATTKGAAKILVR